MDRLPLLVVGNPTIDLNRVFGRTVGPRLGGTSAFAALALSRFGHKVVVAGRMGRDLEPLLAPLRDAGSDVRPLEAAATLRFENIYPDKAHPERREQSAHSVPPAITAADLDGLLARPFAGVLLGPLTATDLTLDLFRAVCALGAPVAADVQGFLRSVDREGRVEPRPWPEARSYLEGVSLVHAGEDEAQALLGEPVAGPECAERLARELRVEAVAVTRGGDGAWIYSAREGLVPVPAYRPGPRVEDPTGCGDIFLAALFHGRLAGWPAARAGRFAAMAAALNAYRPTLHCPTVEEVERALASAGPPARRRVREPPRAVHRARHSAIISSTPCPGLSPPAHRRFPTRSGCSSCRVRAPKRCMSSSGPRRGPVPRRRSAG